ncbi:MAG TPA: ribonuclease HI [Candidatus Hydrogenedentes bacterium]|nr:ribonuclease HI [Candidatus Hydrogenedentota bacterium]HQH54317.1 ribonuclease HI [Candidatus Hydrogenedentota bacterium]
MKGTKNDVVTVYTDGGCEPNPGRGGWGVVLVYKGKVKELSGHEDVTTNNRMELTAAVKALEALRRPCHVALHTDSQYLQKGITDWMRRWKRNGWRTRGGAVKNQDLWQRIDDLTNIHDVKWHWVRGHAGDPFNERCDALVREARIRR